MLQKMLLELAKKLLKEKEDGKEVENEELDEEGEDTEEVTMPKEEFQKEHEELISKLLRGDEEELEEEAGKQTKELKHKGNGKAVVIALMKAAKGGNHG